MLLEAYHLLKNRIGQGQSDTQSHGHFSDSISKTYRTWRLVLNVDGSVRGIEPMGEAEASGYWSLVEGTSAQKKRFPALRPKKPLLVLPLDDDRWKTLENLSQGSVAEVKALLLRLAIDLKGSIDLTEAWELKAAPILDWQVAENETDLLVYLKQCVMAFGHFCGRDDGSYLEYETETGQKSIEWREEIEKRRSSQFENMGHRLVLAFVDLLQNATEVDQIKAIAASLFGTRKKKKGEDTMETEFATQLCVDLHLPEMLGSTIYTPRIANMVLGCLGAKSSADGPQGVCAISGVTGPLLKTKVPEWDSPLFKTPPYSKFSAAPCNQRYGKFGLDGFDISFQLAGSLVGALGKRGMTASSLEWRTWAKLQNGKFKRQSGKKPMPLQDLMLVYPSFDVEDLVTVDVFIQPPAENPDVVADQAKQFVDCAERLCVALREKSSSESSETEYMRIMLVEKVSQGQVQLSYSAMPTVQEFIFAMETWSRSAENLPRNLQVPLPSKKSATGFRRRTPRLLFPAQIGRLLTQHWTRDGSEFTTVQGPTLGMVLDLFLRKQGVWEDAAIRLLEMTLARSEALLIGASHVLHRDGPASVAHWTKFIAKAQFGKVKRQPDYALEQTVSLLGTLLYTMNSTVQTYTNESAYLVGKLLAMMDELHKCYCVAERKGDIPNSLIGNSLLGRAADSPALALDELRERSRIYIGWAKTASAGDGATDKKRIAVASARKVLRLAQPIAEQLHTNADLAKELSAVSKAHLFLGYLAPVLGKDESGGETTVRDSGEVAPVSKI